MALALDGGSVATAAVAAKGSPTRDGFEAWAQREALGVHGAVADLTEIELDGEPGAEWVARVCHDDGWSETFLVQRGAHRWSVPHESWGHTHLCSPAATRGWLAPASELSLEDTGPGFAASHRLAIVDERVVVAAQTEWEHDGARTVRWDIASLRDRGHQGRVVFVRNGNAVAPESGPTFVTAGRSSWQGQADAALEVVGERRNDGTVIVRIVFRDDEHRSGLGGDRLELKWRAPSSREIRALDVRSDATGALRAVTLGAHPPLDVHGSVHDLEVVLDWRIDAADRDAVAALTVVAHDVDGDGATTVATSEYDGQPTSLGELRYFAGGGNYPAVGRRAADAGAVDSLPAPAAPAR
ncbi:MAG: hypothetical protein AAF721_00610 [Myxococcota bacterium]